jgi:UDP-glucose 4-epimerase
LDLKDKNIIVVGGCGVIGSTLIDLLLAEAEPKKITVIDNLYRGTMANLESALASGRVEVVRQDIRDVKALRPLFDGVDAVFHQAAIRITACASEPRDCLDVLINGTYNVLECCVDAGVKKVVAASSASVYGAADEFPTTETHHPYNNRTWYGAAKVANEGTLRSFNHLYGLEYIALRYFNVFGPRMDVFGKYTEVFMKWMDLIDRGESPKIYGDGSHTMDFVFTEDVARANLAAMRSDKSDEVYNVGTGVETSLLEVVDSLLRACGAEHLKPEFVEECSVNPVPRRLADVSKAKRDLGFEAQVGFDEGVRRLVEWRNDVIARGQKAEYDPKSATA